MMMNWQITIGLLIAYLLGSIPSAVWYGKWFNGIDIREHGSGNAGAANTFRVLGKKAGAVVLFFDALKGALAVGLVSILHDKGLISAENHTLFQLTFGFTALIGHLFPVFAGFKGGKGVATFLGMMLVIHWKVALLCVLVFVVVFYFYRYTSLASMLGAMALPISLMSGIFGETDTVLIRFSWFCAFVIVFMHRDNIKRLLAGNENRISPK